MKKTGLTDGSFVHTVIRKRPKGVHKGDCGRILLIAGSRDMAGAAVLCARAALRCGSGLVSVCAKKQIFPVLQSSVPEASVPDGKKRKGSCRGMMLWQSAPEWELIEGQKTS